jgi:hypothetical protein
MTSSAFAEFFSTIGHLQAEQTTFEARKLTRFIATQLGQESGPGCAGGFTGAYGTPSSIGRDGHDLKGEKSPASSGPIRHFFACS